MESVRAGSLGENRRQGFRIQGCGYGSTKWPRVEERRALDGGRYLRAYLAGRSKRGDEGHRHHHLWALHRQEQHEQ